MKIMQAKKERLASLVFDMFTSTCVAVESCSECQPNNLSMLHVSLRYLWRWK